MKRISFKQLERISKKKLKKTLFTKNGVPKCSSCGKPMEIAYDSRLKKKSKHLWKPVCNCIPKNLRLYIL